MDRTNSCDDSTEDGAAAGAAEVASGHALADLSVPSVSVPARVETASLFAWHRGRWGAPRAAVLCDVSPSGATVVVGTDRPLRSDRTYALRLPRTGSDPLWLICAVASQEELGRGLFQIGFRFASQILQAAAA